MSSSQEKYLISGVASSISVISGRGCLTKGSSPGVTLDLFSLYKSNTSASRFTYLNTVSTDHATDGDTRLNMALQLLPEGLDRWHS